MKVRTILAKKGTHVETTGAATPVGSAVELLVRKRIGCLVLCDRDGEIVGVLDERDIIHGMSTHGHQVFDLPVRSVMKCAPVSCTPEHDVKEVMSIMTGRRVRHVIVMAGRELCGVISIGDVVKHRMEEAQLEVSVLRDYARSRGSFAQWGRR